MVMIFKYRRISESERADVLDVILVGEEWEKQRRKFHCSLTYMRGTG
jgi:hypothetical protein